MLIRLIPVAPFGLVNLAAGANGVPLRAYMLGTISGLAPGIIALTLFSGQLRTVLEKPDAVNLAILLVLAAVIIAIGSWFWRRFAARIEKRDR